MFWRKTQRLRDSLNGTKVRVEKFAGDMEGPNQHNYMHHMLWVSPTGEPIKDIPVLSYAVGLSLMRHCGEWNWLVQLRWLRNPHRTHGFKGRDYVRYVRCCGVCGKSSIAKREGYLWRRR